jgi:hypothetical protein
MKHIRNSIGLALSLLIMAPAAQAVSEGGYDSTALLLFPGQAMTAVNELPKKIEDLQTSLKRLQEKAKEMKVVKNTKDATRITSEAIHVLYEILQNDIDKILDLIVPTLVSACKILGDPKLNNIEASRYMVKLNDNYDKIVVIAREADILLQRIKQTMIDKPQIVPSVPVTPPAAFDE